jgi:hypothetical protein
LNDYPDQPGDDMSICRTRACAAVAIAIALLFAAPATAQTCTRQGNDVTCDDGKRGIFTGDAIVWADGTRANLASPHPSVVIGKPSVIVGQGVMVGSGSGKGVVPMENPSAQSRCPVLDGVAYCY